MGRHSLAIAVCVVLGTVALAGSAQASSAPPSGRRPSTPTAGSVGIQNGSEWTFSNDDSGACEVLTFQTDPDDFSGDLGDTGKWHGGTSSIRLVFERGPGPSGGFSPGLFTGHRAKSDGDYFGKFHYKIPMFNEKTENALTQGAQAAC